MNVKAGAWVVAKVIGAFLLTLMLVALTPDAILDQQIVGGLAVLGYIAFAGWLFFGSAFFHREKSPKVPPQ